MDFSFYFEDGQGNIVNENGEDPMEIAEDENPFNLEELTSYTEGEKKICNEEASKKAQGARVNNDIRARAVHLVDIHPKNSARAVALNLKLELRTLQRWYKTWKEDPDSLFKTIGRPRIIEPEGELAEATRNVVADLYFKQPTSTIDQLMDRLNSSFSELPISKKTLYRYMADL
ncbi:hypothetical protein K501DRAFT_136154, partial [Backusella circina FSU 941]